MLGTGLRPSEVLSLRWERIQTLPTVYHEAYRANSVGRAGCDAFTLARIAGHSSITITQRYCHPQADAIERVFAKLPAGAIATPETARPTAAR
jgi:integrase